MAYTVECNSPRELIARFIRRGLFFFLSFFHFFFARQMKTYARHRKTIYARRGICVVKPSFCLHTHAIEYARETLRRDLRPWQSEMYALSIFISTQINFPPPPDVYNLLVFKRSLAYAVITLSARMFRLLFSLFSLLLVCRNSFFFLFFSRRVLIYCFKNSKRLVGIFRGVIQFRTNVLLERGR